MLLKAFEVYILNWFDNIISLLIEMMFLALQFC